MTLGKKTVRFLCLTEVPCARLGSQREQYVEIVMSFSINVITITRQHFPWQRSFSDTVPNLGSKAAVLDIDPQNK